jgi:hypothetical protein
MDTLTVVPHLIFGQVSYSQEGEMDTELRTYRPRFKLSELGGRMPEDRHQFHGLLLELPSKHASGATHTKHGVLNYAA